MLRKNKKPVKLYPKKYDDFVVNTVVSEGFCIEGDLIGKGSVKIDGSVTGNIKIEEGLIVGEAGEVIGDIHAENVIVFGKIVGDIVCKILKVNPSGFIAGNVSTQFMGIDLGGKINGKIEILEEPKQPMLLEQKVG